ncbi:gamma-glutamylcyclotransferase [Alishewanella longhuensis]|uniref:glutathione-specific gamma-glutamylcyclotransferase n=1 Tax=Alishewanella longhuensis TaxID=1091037 RepID=A0ABQ3KZL0_9ALTE|nr:gamma-glutamylcyclotransferase [Alishewanella longhuensis]GHG62353.1 gamma-glutamylcyclotransferase [Alishewanella longhuensis]
MSHNTIALNQQRQPLQHLESVWLFGYGSLIYKADFPYLQCKPACIYGWQRRFWQGSHDHRGTPEAPGRVVTLVAADGARCVGMAYQVTPETFEHLDHREKNGYLRFFTELHWLDGFGQEVGVVYVASADNAAYLGPASEADIAAHIAKSQGPSGTNSDYLLQLAQALRMLSEQDEHVFAIEQALLLQLEQR